MYEKLDYKQMIESGFTVIDKKGVETPFIFNNIQNDFTKKVDDWFPEQQGIRVNIDKARREGFSAFIDAVFTVDFLARENIGAQIISHKESETEFLFKRVSHYLDSFCEKNGLSRKDILSTDSTQYLENKNNGSYIFIGTAGAKTLGRGGTLQNIHWSEVAFYPSGPLTSPETIVTGAEQQVAMGVGKIFRESTGNTVGDFFHGECERSRIGESNFKFAFYPWFMHNDYRSEDPIELNAGESSLVTKVMQAGVDQAQINWYIKKSREYKTMALFFREYPTTFEDSFLVTGEGFFDKDALLWYREMIKQPIKMGRLAPDGDWT
jgi:hypothetical protein